MASAQDLDDAADGLDPTKPNASYTPELKTLPDGDYMFRVAKASEDTTKDGQKIIKLTLEVHEGDANPRKVQHTYWITRKDDTIDLIALDIFNRDLATLGFDTGEWKKAKGRPWSAEVTRALKLLPGIQFEGKKTTKDGHPRLYVNTRNTKDGKPEKFGPGEAPAPRAVDIPF